MARRPLPRLLSHVDLRVRDRERGAEFYEALLGVLGATRDDGEHWTSFAFRDRDVPDPEPEEWFGITEDPHMTPSHVRIAFAAPSRGVVDTIATLLPAMGALAIEPPHEAYGPAYYACFFTDPDGNPLEVVHIERAAHPVE